MPRKKAASAEDPKQELKLDAVEPQGLTAVNGARLSTSEVGNEPENISQDVSPEGTSEANEASEIPTTSEGNTFVADTADKSGASDTAEKAAEGEYADGFQAVAKQQDTVPDQGGAFLVPPYGEALPVMRGATPDADSAGPNILSVDLSEPVSLPAVQQPGEESKYGFASEHALQPVPEDGESLLKTGEFEAGTLPGEAVSDNMLSASPQEVPKTDRQKFYELRFNQLDRDLTTEERQEWNSIYASYRGHSVLSGTIIGVDPYSVNVWNRETETSERQTMYCAIVIPYRVRIVIPATEMWERGKERPNYAFFNMVGSNIDFVITKVERESNFAIASRRLALQARRYYFAHRPNLNVIGTRVKCRMLVVGPRRCLVECFGHDLDLTQRELRYTAIPDLREEYHPGQELEAIVKVYDPETDRLEISIKETESNPYEGAEQRHPEGSRRLAMIAGKYGGGVFCNLPDGTVCMCNYSYQHDDSDFPVGSTVILVVLRYDADKQQMYGKILSKW